MDDATPIPARRPHTRVRIGESALSGRLAAVLVFCMALAPRAVQGSFVTVDEAFHWFDRCEKFLRAIRAGDYAGTFLIGHPGVTTMWLGAAGIIVHERLAALGLVAPDDPDAHRLLLRLPVALATSLCLALAYLLLRRLVDRRVALLAALFWAADPFLVAHSQLLHLDALLTSFITLALLSALVAFDSARSSDPGHSIRRGALALAGVSGGLALLTKSPAIILVPMVGLIAVVHARSDRWRSAAIGLAAWAGSALATWFVLWPALWIDLPGAVGRMVHQISAEGNTPHGWGNFFMGRAVADPGPFFYPVAAALRMTPWTMIGLLVLPVAVWNARAGKDTDGRFMTRRLSFGPRHTVLLLLAGFVLLFTAMLTFPPKKFDRYLLPIFPALDILAAAGLVWVAERRLALRDRLRRRSVGWGMIVLGLSANLAWYHPYALAYYNPLLGGGPVAARAIPVGWGEGYEQAGAYISAQPDGADRPVAAWFEPVLRPYVRSPVIALDYVFEPGRVGYALLYIDQIQRGNVPEAIAYLRSQFRPVHTIRIHGIDYVEIYQLPQLVARPVQADFGPSITFRGYDVDTSAVRSSGFLTMTLHWQARGPISDDYLLFVHVLDARGRRVGQADVPPGGPRAPTSAWQPGHYVTSVQRVPVQPDLPSGTYWVAIGLYNSRDFARVPLRAAAPPHAPGDGADALLLGPVSVD